MADVPEILVRADWSHAIVGQWDSLEKSVQAIIDAEPQLRGYTFTESLKCLRIGYRKQSEIVVKISVQNYAKPSEWIDAEKASVELLERESLMGVCCLFERA